MNWREIWQKKGNVTKSIVELKDLISLDGYDTGAVVFPEESWIDMVGTFEKKINLQQDQLLCELGCGSGAFLFPLYRKGYKVSGIDFASSLINICKKAMPKGTFKVAEAYNIPFPSEHFEVVLSNGVFHYFPDLAYAENVIHEMLRILKPCGKGAILDTNDYGKKDAYAVLRKTLFSPQEYARLYKDYPHLFYKKTWFEEIARKFNLKYTIIDQNVPGHTYSPFRFNCYFEKR